MAAALPVGAEEEEEEACCWPGAFAGGVAVAIAAGMAVDLEEDDDPAMSDEPAAELLLLPLPSVEAILVL